MRRKDPLRRMSRSARANYSKNYGPCYDFCMCRCCWWGWKTISPPQRVWQRVLHIHREGFYA